MALYAITITPRYRMVAPTVLHRNYEQRIVRLLNKVSNHYLLYPEFSKDSRLHYHGVIQIKDLIKWHHIKHEVDQIGFTHTNKFKSHIEHLRWLYYCKKEEGTTGLQPIIYKRASRLYALSQRDKEDIKAKPNILQYFKIIT